MPRALHWQIASRPQQSTGTASATHHHPRRPSPLVRLIARAIRPASSPVPPVRPWLCLEIAEDHQPEGASPGSNAVSTRKKPRLTPKRLMAQWQIGVSKQGLALLDQISVGALHDGCRAPSTGKSPAAPNKALAQPVPHITARAAPRHSSASSPVPPVRLPLGRGGHTPEREPSPQRSERWTPRLSRPKNPIATTGKMQPIRRRCRGSSPGYRYSTRPDFPDPRRIARSRTHRSTSRQRKPSPAQSRCRA